MQWRLLKGHPGKHPGNDLKIKKVFFKIGDIHLEKRRGCHAPGLGGVTGNTPGAVFKQADRMLSISCTDVMPHFSLFSQYLCKKGYIFLD
jgi:hypothetical protein